VGEPQITARETCREFDLRPATPEEFAAFRAGHEHEMLPPDGEGQRSADTSLPPATARGSAQHTTSVRPLRSPRGEPGRRDPARGARRWPPPRGIDPVEDPRACAYDHANELIDALKDAEFEVAVRLDERSFEQLERAE
jgi:hypothetical protein